MNIGEIILKKKKTIPQPIYEALVEDKLIGEVN